MTQAKKIPLRKCVGCQEMLPKRDLLRVLRTEDGSVILDLSGRMNGRGAYLCRKQECLKKAVKSKSLERSLSSKIEDDTYEKLKKEIESIEE